MKGSSHRGEQVAETVRQVLADLLLRGEVRDPRVVPAIVVTRVQVTNELSIARVSVAIPGEEADRARALEGLRSAAGFLRSRVARSLSTWTVPELRFELDRSGEYAARIDALLNEIRREGQD
jgi:ribosome-binding factor A